MQTRRTLVLTATMALVLAFTLKTAPAHWVLDFNNVHGSNDDEHVQFGNIGSHAEYTAEAWINPRRISGDGDHASHGFTIFGCSNDYSLWLLHRDGEIKAFAYEDGTSDYTETDGAGIETNTFGHVALTAVRNGTAQIYVNGVLLETFNAGSDNSWGNLALGVLRAGRGIGMDGIIMEARLWDHVRSAEEIQGLMDTRLSGDEAGLLGYWPMNEGAGFDTVHDLSGNDHDGSINGPSWVMVMDSPLEIVADFLPAPPFTLADQQTGSTDFTNSNEVDLVAFPIPAGYDRFQFTESGGMDAIDTNGWEPTNTVPERVPFTQPDADTDITLYAWFTNSMESVALRRAESGIRYTTGTPELRQPRPGHTCYLYPGWDAVVFTVEELDPGPTVLTGSGTTGGEPIPLHGMYLTRLEGPGADLTPDAPEVTLAEPGDYTLRFTVMNAAGNVAQATETYSLALPPTFRPALVVEAGQTVTFDTDRGIYEGDLTGSGGISNGVAWFYFSRIDLKEGATVELTGKYNPIALDSRQGIRLAARGWLTVTATGRIDVSGGRGGDGNQSGGGGSGGGIMLSGHSVFLAEGAQLLANGGRGGNGDRGGGGGGGGRIYFEATQLRMDGVKSSPGLLLSGEYISAIGGPLGVHSSRPGNSDGEDGTIYFHELPAFGTLIIVR